jgi:hypothetical protein
MVLWKSLKARLVADGNTQKAGVDFNRIFSSVVKTTTIRLVLAIAAARDYNLTSIDIRQAYLQAELKEDLFMRCPPNVYAFDSKKRPLCCRLRRSLYGLKQAGREWAMLFTSFHLSWGFLRCRPWCRSVSRVGHRRSLGGRSRGASKTKQPRYSAHTGAYTRSRRLTHRVSQGQ